ncbi:MAG: hypothetical protein ACERKD_09520 [Prolixibacteraceae bacterium]
MKRRYHLFLILTGLLLGQFTLHAQNSFSLSGNYTVLPQSGMEGLGYKAEIILPFKHSLYLSANLGFIHAWKTTPAPLGNYENYELFPLNGNHAAYQFAVQTGYHFQLSKVVHISCAIGPSASYQSTLIERSKYKTDERFSYLTINQDFNEGLYYGGAATFTLGIDFNEQTSLLLYQEAMAYFKAQSTLNTGIGIQFTF